MHYRKIWESINGVIPPGYEIHHKDKNRNNNSIDNLQLVSIEEHLEIHRTQNDYGAVQAILLRMHGDNSKDIAEVSSENQKRLLSEGKHNFQKIDRILVSQTTMKRRLEKGLPAFLGIKDPIENSRKAGLKAKEFHAGFLNVESENHGSKYVKDTFWWTNSNGQHKRCLESPGDNWTKGMKYE